MSSLVCRPKTLLLDRLDEARRLAIEINPDNQAAARRVRRTPPGRRGGQSRLAVVVGKKWKPSGVRLSVSFLDTPSTGLRSRILLHMNAWAESANVRFSETNGQGEVRIARLDSPIALAGYWSYVGTDILSVDKGEPTMNLEGFTMKTSDAEFRRVVRHEAGHTLGFEHEHLREGIVKQIHRTRAYAYFDREMGWSRQEVDAQVLTPLSKHSVMGTSETDPVSIMCYELPGAIMKDGKPVKGGKDINARDFEFAASIYPKKAADTRVPDPAVSEVHRADPNDDVDTLHIIVLDDFSRSESSSKERPEFAQVLASYGGARVTSTLRLRMGRDGERTNWGQIIAMQERLRAYTNREHGSLPADDEMIAFGRQLFDTLFQGDVRRLYDEARTRQQRRRLDLVLTSKIPWIAEKPWEFAFDAGRRSFLATEEVHFVRNVLTNVPADPISRVVGPIRILVAAAQPVGFGRLSVEQETAIIRRGFSALLRDGSVVIEIMPRATPASIHEAVTHGGFHAVHFIGHGVYDEASEQGCLVFENERGGSFTLGEREVREIFCKRGLSMVFLNACETGRGGRAEFNKGVAQSLVEHGLPALVANQYSVLDSSATSFAQHFYHSIARGLSLGEAAREARIAVNYSVQGESIDWAVPVLYARDPAMKLCIPRPSDERDVGRLASDIRMARAGSVAPRASLVAVCDIDDVFPGLEQTLNLMNAAQDVFGFTLANLSTPLDVWDVGAKDGLDFLWAERLAKRLQNKAAELNVDVLACVTRHWLRDDRWFYLYGWWPGEMTPPVIIFSVAGFDQLEPEGPTTDRAIANAMVSGLAGFYGNVDTHSKGAKDCPLAFNQDRDFRYVAGSLKFDASCRRRLAKLLGNKLPALEALLGAFSAE